jgi:uncharacterized Fe-S cluster-containing radical SAM superfamily protein
MRLMRTRRSRHRHHNRCNLRCRYCYHFESAGDAGGDLPASEWLRFFEELGRLAVTEVTMAGGEPFIREDLREIVGGIVKNRMRFAILSNGTLITDEMAAFLASTGRCNYVQVSIDGSMPESHDAMRGRGSFERAVEGLLALLRNGVPAAVRVTIHRRNVHDLEAIARLLLEDIGLSSFGTNSASAMGLCRKNAEMVQLTTEERGLAMATLLRLTRKYHGRIQARAGPLAEAPGLVGHGGGPAREKGADGAETGVSQRLRLLPVGSRRAGRRRHRALHDAFPHRTRPHQPRRPRGGLERPRSAQQPQAKAGDPPDELFLLRGVPLRELLHGNCPGLSYTLTGEVNHPSPDACLRKVRAEGGRLPDRSLLC